MGGPGPLRVGGLRAGGALADEGGEIDRIVGLLRRLIQPGEPEHVVDQGAHSLGLQRDAVHRLVDLRAVAQRALLVQLGVGAQ